METRLVNIPVSIFRELYCSDGEEACEYCSFTGVCSLYDEQTKTKVIEVCGNKKIVYVRCDSCRKSEVEQY